MWLTPSSSKHTGHTPLSMFPLIPFSLQMPILHHPIPFLSSNVQRLIQSTLSIPIFQIRFNIILPFTPRSSKWSLS
jgi:hypothetical protein